MTDLEPSELSTVTPSVEVPPPAVVQRKRPYALLACIAVVLLALVGVGAWLIVHGSSKPAVTMSTYFAYSKQDVDALKGIKSTATMNIAQARMWQEKAYELVEEHQTIDVDASKVYAYLAVAQMDAAALSQQAHHAFVGSIGLVSKDVLCKFYPDSCSSLLVDDGDPYSTALSHLVMTQVAARMKADDAQTKPSVLKTGVQYWNNPAPQIGLTAASFKPWLIKSADQFRVAPPPAAGSTEQQQQLATVKQALASDTDEQKAIVVKWAGGPGTKTPPGIWLSLADTYMQGHAPSFETYVQIKAATSTAMADAVIAVFDSKYTYQYKRPNMFDTSIITIMPTPNHPSYPAGHATISWAAATVLDHYLPANQKEWDRLAKEASDSRTLGGIHFPMDNVAGTTLGKNVGNEVLKNW